MKNTHLQTGYVALDRILLGGFYNQTTTLIYSNPRNGITNLMTKIASGILAYNKPCTEEKTEVLLYVTFERNSEEVSDAIKLLNDSTDCDLDLRVKYFDRKTATVNDIIDTIHQLHELEGCNVRGVIIESINCINGETSYSMSHTINACRNVSVDINIPFILGLNDGDRINTFKPFEFADVVIMSELQEDKLFLTKVKNRYETNSASLSLF